MNGKFYIEKNSLIFELNNQKEAYKLPYLASSLECLDAFIKDLNRRASKIDINADMIKVNSHYVFIEASKTIKVKFPDRKGQTIIVNKDTHTMAKVGAKKAGLTIGEYVKLCIINSKSDTK